MEVNKIKVEHGAPSSQEGRADRELRCYLALDNLGISYERADHNAAHTMEDCLAVEEALGVKIPKNLLLCNRQQTDFYLLMLPGDKVFKTKDISQQLNTARLSFATEEHMVRFLDIYPGSLSVLGLVNDKDHNVRLVVDKDVLDCEYIGCHPCVNTSTLAIRTEDIINKFVSSVGHSVTVVTLPEHTDEE